MTLRDFAGVACWSLLVLGVTRHPESPEQVIQRSVASQANTELAMTSRVNVHFVDPKTVTIQDGPRVSPRLKTWRAAIPTDHWHPYLVGSDTYGLILLGGFSGPDLKRASAILSRGTTDRTTIEDLCHKLAALADGQGAVQYVFLAAGDSSGGVARVRRAWARRAPTSWPADTVLRTSSGGWSGRVTMISRATRSYTLHWIPSAYSFEFDERGDLLSWASRVGDGFGVPEVPLLNTAEPWETSN